jgi:hypothetical protein
MRSGFSSEFLHNNFEMPLNGPFRYAKNPPLRRVCFQLHGDMGSLDAVGTLLCAVQHINGLSPTSQFFPPGRMAIGPACGAGMPA